MIPDNFKVALAEITPVLDKEKIPYTIVGSTNLALQGMDVTPKDIDIVVLFKDLEKLPSLFPNIIPSKRIIP